MASNALYAKMINAAQVVNELRVASREDLALLLILNEDAAGAHELMSAPDFDRARYTETLAAIGLRELVQ